MQAGKNLIACDSFPLLNLEIRGNSISWYGVFSVKNLRIDVVCLFCFVLFCFGFRMNTFPFPVDVFSKKQKFCSSFICKLGGPFIKLSSFISILYKMFILISILLFQSFNSVFPWGWIQSSRLTRYKCPCTCLDSAVDSRTQLENMPTEY